MTQDKTHRAAQDFLSAQLPPHGRHAGPHDPRTTVRDDGSGGGSLVIPSRAVESAERTNTVYQVEDASARLNPRRGRIEHAEGVTTRDPNVPAAFAQSFQSARAQEPGKQFYEVQPSGTRSPLAGPEDSGNPVWSTDVPQNVGAFLGIVEGALGKPGNVPALSERSTPHTMVDMSRVDLGRGRVTYGKTYGSDVKQIRANEAMVRD
jgi:hypothetical protein